MSIDRQLFEGKLIRLAPIDHDKDPESIALWTNEAVFMRLMYIDPVRPLAPWQVKKKLEALEKAIEEERSAFYFTIRERIENRLLGLAEIHQISWTNRAGRICLGIGSATDWRKGYGRDALLLLVRYAFNELNLHRLTALIPEYNPAAEALFKSVGFVEEVRRRKALARGGRTWDSVNYGLLAAEWKDIR